MKAKNVSKNIGKRVVFKVPVEEVTYANGAKLSPTMCSKFFPQGTTIRLLSDILDSDGDVRISTALPIYAYVHHEFIKLANKESK